jgi:hypothetical protein
MSSSSDERRPDRRQGRELGPQDGVFFIFANGVVNMTIGNEFATNL